MIMDEVLISMFERMNWFAALSDALDRVQMMINSGDVNDFRLFQTISRQYARKIENNFQFNYWKFHGSFFNRGDMLIIMSTLYVA